MSTYVIGDIHGCYFDLLHMLECIEFNDEEDRLICVGDYLDYGPLNYDMLIWIEQEHPKNCILLKGDHELDFITTIDLLISTCNVKGWNISSLDDSKKAYNLMREFMKAGKTPFDEYLTIHFLMEKDLFTLADLKDYAGYFRNMKLGTKLFIDGRTHVIVHSGYLPKRSEEFYGHPDRDHFSTYAGREAFEHGGLRHAVIVSGHNPTTEQGFYYNSGNIYQYYNSDIDCMFYDIDCGSGLRNKTREAKLACIRLDDKQFFYI